ncbi:MAG: FAD-dependent oxidoreductase [Raoultibacter sp.]
MSKASKATTVSRRDLFKLGGVAAVGALGAGALAGCAPSQVASGATPTTATAAPSDGTPAFLIPPEPITDFVDTKEFDIVVVGAGVAGISAVHTALEAGASVACLQKEATPVTQGNMSACIVLEECTEAQIQAAVSLVIHKSDHRANRDLINVWAHKSSEAVRWWGEAAAELGVESKPSKRIIEWSGQPISLYANTYFHVEGNHNACALVLAEQAASQGAEFFYKTPAEQLMVEDGAVTGAIGKTDEGYVLFKATKGVILATGDYQNNDEMLHYYVPDCKGLRRKQINKTGDGHRMGTWAGGRIEDVNHTKMIHDPRSRRADVPFLAIDRHSKRFMCEEVVMGNLNNYWRPWFRETNYKVDQAGIFFQVVDANWEAQGNEWQAIDPQTYDISTCKQENFVEGATFEELAEKINAYCVEKGHNFELDPTEFAASVNRYNELCAKGEDDDFGKNPLFMRGLDTPPYYGICRGDAGLSAILGGLIVDVDNRVLDENDEAIPGLFAVGNCGGGFYGGVDYPMDILGLSLGRAITTGYEAGRYVAAL